MTYTPPLPTNNDDVIDSRDVIHWIAELESIEVIDREPEDQDTLDALYALQEEAEGSPDWQYGEALIRDTYFEDYAEETSREYGYIADNLPGFIENAINWGMVADALKADYFSVEFDGETYWIRG